MDEVEQLADRVVVLDRGRVIAGGTPDQLKTRGRGHPRRRVLRAHGRGPGRHRRQLARTPPAPRGNRAAARHAASDRGRRRARPHRPSPAPPPPHAAAAVLRAGAARAVPRDAHPDLRDARRAVHRRRLHPVPPSWSAGDDDGPQRRVDGRRARGRPAGGDRRPVPEPADGPSRAAGRPDPRRPRPQRSRDGAPRRRGPGDGLRAPRRRGPQRGGARGHPPVRVRPDLGVRGRRSGGARRADRHSSSASPRSSRWCSSAGRGSRWTRWPAGSRPSLGTSRSTWRSRRRGPCSTMAPTRATGCSGRSCGLWRSSPCSRCSPSAASPGPPRP